MARFSTGSAKRGATPPEAFSAGDGAGSRSRLLPKLLRGKPYWVKSTQFLSPSSAGIPSGVLSSRVLNDCQQVEGIAMLWGYGVDMGFSWLFALLVLAGIVFLVLLAVRVFGGSHDRSGGNGATGSAAERSRARQILDERYATGELTAEQYREQIRVLSESP